MANTSDRLKEIMNERNMSQSELCRITGISKSTLSQWVSGTRTPKADGLYMLAKALNVNETWLMGKDVPKNILDAEIEAKSVLGFIELYSKLTEEEQRETFRYMEYLLSQSKKTSD